MPKAIFKQVPRIGTKTLVLLIISMILLVLDGQQKNYLKSIRYYLNTLVAPLQYTVSYPSELFQAIKTSVVTQKQLIAENQALNEQLLRANMRLQKLLALEQENDSLRSLLSSAQTVNLPDRVKVAELLSVSSGISSSEMLVASGHKQQVYLGQPVLDAYGIVGQIVDVGVNTSRLMLLTNSQSAIPVENNRTGFTGILAGTGADELTLMHVPKTEAMQEGDLLVTSGQGKVFPPGYPVGVIQQIKQDPDEKFSQISVAPSAHLTRSHFVLLVWPAAQQLQTIQPGEGG